MVIERGLPNAQAGGNLTRSGCRVTLRPEQLGGPVEHSLLHGGVGLNRDVSDRQHCTALAHWVNLLLSLTEHAEVPIILSIGEIDEIYEALGGSTVVSPGT